MWDTGVEDEILRCAQYRTNKVSSRKVQCPQGHFVKVACGFNRPAIWNKLRWYSTQNDKGG
jgi:hypothetical protein